VAKQGQDSLLLRSKDHGVHLPVVRHVDLECDNGIGNVDDLVHAIVDVVGLDKPFQFLVHFVGDKADAHMGLLDAPGREVEDGAGLQDAFGHLEGFIDHPKSVVLFNDILWRQRGVGDNDSCICCSLTA